MKGLRLQKPLSIRHVQNGQLASASYRQQQSFFQIRNIQNTIFEAQRKLTSQTYQSLRNKLSLNAGRQFRQGSQYPRQQEYSVFVENLNQDCTWEDLKDLFSGSGDVKHAKVLKYRISGDSYGIIKYGSEEETIRAVEDFNQTEFQNQVITVRPDNKTNDTRGGQSRRREYEDVEYSNPRTRRNFDARSKPARPLDETPIEIDEDFKRKYQFTDDITGQAIIMSGLPYRFDWRELRDFIQQDFEDVAYVRIFTNDNGQSKGLAKVIFNTKQSAKEAIEKFDKIQLGDQVISCWYDKFDKKSYRQPQL